MTRGVTVLMLAAGIGRDECVQALLNAGADRTRSTARCKMLALYLAAEAESGVPTQILLGSGPPPDQLRIEISLASQHAALVKDGQPVFSTICSTGRQGFSTRAGNYVITDKERSHRSTIYKVEMPYFMRLSCLDFGMHEGVVLIIPRRMDAFDFRERPRASSSPRSRLERSLLFSRPLIGWEWQACVRR